MTLKKETKELNPEVVYAVKFVAFCAGLIQEEPVLVGASEQETETLNLSIWSHPECADIEEKISDLVRAAKKETRKEKE